MVMSIFKSSLPKNIDLFIQYRLVYKGRILNVDEITDPLQHILSLK